jgi:hypothetical protein
MESMIKIKSFYNYNGQLRITLLLILGLVKLVEVHTS